MDVVKEYVEVAQVLVEADMLEPFAVLRDVLDVGPDQGVPVVFQHDLEADADVAAVVHVEIRLGLLAPARILHGFAKRIIRRGIFGIVQCFFCFLRRRMQQEQLLTVCLVRVEEMDLIFREF